MLARARVIRPLTQFPSLRRQLRQPRGSSSIQDRFSSSVTRHSMVFEYAHCQEDVNIEVLTRQPRGPQMGQQSGRCGPQTGQQAGPHNQQQSGRRGPQTGQPHRPHRPEIIEGVRTQTAGPQPDGGRLPHGGPPSGGTECPPPLGGPLSGGTVCPPPHGGPERLPVRMMVVGDDAITLRVGG